MLSSLPTKHSIAHVHWYLVSKTKTFLFGDHRKKTFASLKLKAEQRNCKKFEITRPEVGGA